MKTTRYFRALRNRPDRAIIKDEWIQRAIQRPKANMSRRMGAYEDGPE